MADMEMQQSVFNRVAQEESRPHTRAELPPGSVGFDWRMTALSALFLAGLWVDGWAHFHGEVDDSFFTPWHFMFYGTFALVAATLTVTQLRNIGRGYGFWRALPYGYMLSLVGAGVFALSGLGDMVWHSLFGIESGTEALMSPSHIGLAVGMTWIFAGPLRAAWRRVHLQNLPPTWLSLGPVVLGLTYLLTVAMFFSSYANPVVTPLVLYGRRASDWQDFGVTSVLLAAALMAGFVLPALRRWRLPFGSLTAMLGLSTALLTVLNDLYVLIPAAVVAGLLADVLVWRWPVASGQAWRLVMTGFCVPALYFAGYFLSVYLLMGRMPWSVHVWSGAIFIAGMVGVSMALLMLTSAHRPVLDAGQKP